MSVTAPTAVVVTGASHGLGAALARHYAAPGVALALIGRNPARWRSSAAVRSAST